MYALCTGYVTHHCVYTLIGKKLTTQMTNKQINNSVLKWFPMTIAGLAVISRVRHSSNIRQEKFSLSKIFIQRRQHHLRPLQRCAVPPSGLGSSSLRVMTYLFQSRHYEIIQHSIHTSPKFIYFLNFTWSFCLFVLLISL